MAKATTKKEALAPLTMTRSEFYNSRPEYQLFPKNVIDGHVMQEEGTRKFLAQYCSRNTDDDDDNFSSDEDGG